MKKTFSILLPLIYALVVAAQHPAEAAGELTKLKGIADGMAAMDEVSKQEGINYDKAKAFINSQEIKEGLTKETVSQRCGEPVAIADNGTRWVYKPPSSTYFKGEKICFIFDESGRLVSWKQVL